MADSTKYNAPSGPPPNYPSQAHVDAGPAWDQRVASPSPYAGNQVGPYQGPTPGFEQQDRGYNQQQYGPPGPYYQQQGYPQQYGPPQGGYYGPPQGMYYQGGPPQGYYAGQRGGPSAGEGICAGLLGALACCCCLDLMF